jgi:hypothetical protein
MALVICAFSVLLLGLSSCTGKINSNLPEPQYASRITEDVLLALNAGDYTTFSRDFDVSMLKAVPASSFSTQFTDGIRGKIGDYLAGSKRFYQASSQAQYTTVVYYASFSGDSGAVMVQISFKMVEGKPLVSGLFFNSPKLRG